MFLRNYWYVAAWDHEVTRDMLARTLLGDPVILFRSEAGQAVALEDRCCHRRLPLRMGKVIGDTVQCHYHGLVFDTSGKCIRVPGQDSVPEAAKVRAYPTVERDRFVWIWMGEPELANPDLIPDYHWIDDPDWGAKGAVFHIKSSYRLIVENLLDLTHLSFVHATTIGNTATVEAAKVEFKRSQDSVDVIRWMIDTPPPPSYIRVGGFAGNVDRWQFVNFKPPSFVRLHTGARDAGGANEGREISLRNLNAITPETETTSHYFWAQCQSVDPANDAITEKIFRDVETAFLQDVEVFEAQQKSIELAPDAPEVDMRGDAGGLGARRIIERLIAEQAAHPAE